MPSIRRATESDREAIEEIVRSAFGGGKDEVDLVRGVWGSDAYLPELELVVEERGSVVAHVLHSRGDIDGRAVAALAPLAVAPAHQRVGIGGALLEEAITRVDRAGWPLIALLGHPTYYPRFGFEQGLTLGIRPLHPELLREPGAFMVRRLSGYDPSLRGLFRYAWEL